jgi:hypothetical protein
MTSGVLFKQAGTWNTNYAQMAKDGTATSADTSVTVPVSFTTIQIGNRSDNLTPFYGPIRNVRIGSSRALSSSELQAITR